MYAITPNGAGRPVGARAIEPDWDLAPGETFVANDWHDGLVLAEGALSLRPRQPDDPSDEPPREIPPLLILDRLEAAGLRSAAKARMTEYQYERFLASQAIRVDDADVLAVLKAIGADPDVILAP